MVSTSSNVNISYTMRANAAPFIREQKKAATAARGVGAAVKQTDTFARGLLRTAGSIAAIFGTMRLFGALNDSIKLHASMVEIDNQVQLIFGDAGRRIVDSYTSNVATKFGASTLAAKGDIAGLGLVLREVFTDPAANLDNAIRLFERASDVASVYDITLSDVIEKIQSGLAGQIRPLRSIGVFTDLDRVKKVIESFGGDPDSRIDKQRAILQIFFEQTAFAIGDFQRTAESAANQQKIFNAQLEDARTKLGGALVGVKLFAIELGTNLLTALLDIGEKLTPFVEGIKSLGEHLEKMGVKDGLIAVIAGLLGGLLLAAIGVVTVATIKWAVAMTVATGGLNLIIPIVGAVIGALVGFEASTQQISQNIGTIITVGLLGAFVAFGGGAAIIPFLIATRFRDEFGRLGQMLASFGGWLKNTFGPLFGTFFNTLADVAARALGLLGQPLRWIADRFLDFLDFLGDKIGPAFSTVFEALPKIVRGAFNAVIAAVEGGLNKALDAVRKFRNAPGFRQVADWAGVPDFEGAHITLGRVSAPAGGGGEGPFAQVFRQINAARGLLGQGVGAVWSGLQRVGGDPIGALGDFAEWIKGTALPAVGLEIERIVAAAKGGVDGIREFFEKQFGLGGGTSPIAKFFRSALERLGLQGFIDYFEPPAAKFYDPEELGDPGLGPRRTAPPGTPLGDGDSASKAASGAGGARVEINLNFYGDVFGLDNFNKAVSEGMERALHQMPPDIIRRVVARAQVGATS